VVSGGFWRVKIRAAPAFGCCRETARVGVPWLAGCPPRMVLAAPLFYSRDTYRYRFWRHRYFIRRRSTARGVWHRAGSRGRGAAMSRGFMSHTQGGGPNQASSVQRFARGGAVSGLSQSAKISTRFSSGVSYHGGDAVHIRQSPRERIQCKHARPDGQDRTLVFACFSAVSYCGGADHAPPSSIRNRISISC
jgi:hypothetical protein